MMSPVVTHSSPLLVGRDAELAELAALLGVAGAGGSAAGPAGSPAGPAGGPTAVLLAGDAGVGKSRLLAELGARAEAAGWAVLTGHCLDFGDSALPYLPFSEVLERMVATAPQVVDDVTGRHPALTRLQPGRRLIGGRGDREGTEDEGPADRAATDRADLLAAVHELLEAAATARPVLLVVEDLHWADRSTRDLLSFLLARGFAGPVRVVGSYRSDDLHRRHPLRRQVAEWSRLRAVSRVQLAPLSDDAVRALVAGLVPSGLEDVELADVVARAEGNPFFVEELTSAAGSPGRWVPSDLADVLLVRLDRLEPPARRVVRAASAAGRRVAYDLLAAVADLDPVALEDGLRGAVEMNVLLAEGGRYEFRHALLGEAVYGDLLPGERVALHRRYVAALQEGVAGGTAAELARHARLGLDLDTALLASIEAGAEAARVGGPVEAAQHYEQALELLTDPRRSAEVDVDGSRVAVRAAEALLASGDPERAVKVLRQHLADLPPSAAPPARARLLSTLAQLLTITEGTDDPVTVSSDAVALVPDGDSGLRAVVLATHARVLADSGQVDAAEPVAVEALGLAERLDRPQLVAHVVTTISGLRRDGSAEGLRAALRRAVEQAAASGELGSELRARYQLARSFQDGGELEAAEEWFRTGMACGVAAGTPYAPYALEARWQLGQLLLATGRWDEAVEVVTPADPVPPPIPRAMLTPVRLAIELARGVDVAADARGLRMFWAREGAVAIHAAAVEIEAAGAVTDAAAAAEAYDAVVDVLGRIWRPYFSAQVRLAALAAGALARTAPVLPAAERAAYSSLVERLHRDGLEVVGRHGAAGDWGVEGRAWTARLEAEVLRFRWAAGVDVPAEDVLVAAWRTAEQAFGELGHVHEVARVRAGLAGILRASGDQAAARALGDQAREVAHRLGATRLLEELRELGSSPLARGEAGPAALTPREHEILTLVAEGRSNGEIARQLYISAKTVSVHVSNILGKLGAAGRTEAAAIARRRGLLG